MYYKAGLKPSEGSAKALNRLPCGLRQFAVNLFVSVNIEGPLNKGKGHLQGLHSKLRAVLSNELQSLNAH